MNNTKKKSGFSFNIVDILIVLMILVIAAAGVFVYIKISSNNIITETKTVECNYTIEIMRSQFKDLVRDGDKVFDNTTNTELGVITGVTYSNATVNVTATDGSDPDSGKTLKYIYPDNEYCKATFTVKCDKADFASGKCKIGEVYIGVGETVVIRTKNFTGSTKCSGFTGVDTSASEQTPAVTE